VRRLIARVTISKITTSNIAMVAICVALLASAPACKRRKVRVETTEESGQSLAAVVNVGDPKASPQLLRGFYDIEGGAWRWTKAKFSVTLRPPLNASQKGATLQFKFAIPDAVISHLKDVTLSGNVNGFALQPETYTKPGDYTYSRDVPASALTGDAVTAEFALDKFLAPGQVDQRELGVVATSIGFEAK
jgi:hypothetical protein